MTINPEIRDQAYQFFIEEAPELLQIIEHGLLTLSMERSTAKIHDLMRAAHSLKGGSASVGLETIKILAHRLENIFKALYNESVEINIDLESKILQAYDCLRLPLMEQIRSGNFNAKQALATAEPIFAQIEAQLGDALTQADNYIPSSSELGVNIALSIFEVDIGEGLKRLATVVANPSDNEVAGELQAQAEVFAGFAELLNLPGFGAIAQAAQQALDANPERAVEITQLALVDFQTGREAVLAGDSTQGGSPSAALLALCGEQGAGEMGSWGAGGAEGAEGEMPNSQFPIPDSQFPEESLSLEEAFSSLAAALKVDTEDNPALAETPVIHQSTELDEELEEIVSALSQEVSDTTVIAPEVEILETREVTPTPSLQDEKPETEQDFHLTPITEAPANLEEALQSIGEIFESLSPIQDIPASTSQLALTDRLQESSLVPFQSTSKEISQTSQSVKLPQELKQASTPTPSAEVSPTSELSVRVNLDRLERMNNLIGEFAINRNSLSLKNQQLQGSVRGLLNRFSRFGNLVSQLRELSDQMLVGWSVFSNQWSVEEVKVGSWQTTNTGQWTTDSSDFDSLEMDNYGVLHSQLQSILEEMLQLEEAVNDIALFAKQSDQTLEQQRQMQTQLRDELMWARMLPLGEVLNRFPRLLRDLSATYHKPVNLKMSGTGVLVDKAVLEKLYDPLVHLLRNAFDHGIESPDIRRQYSKPETGQIEIRAYHRGSQTIIELIDDGQGLNLEQIGSRAVEVGWLSAEELATISEARLSEFIFQPGFSTASQVSELSGRGVGLDIVRSQLRALKGSVSVTSSPGQGTIFTLTLPLTLTIANLLVCLVGTTSLALPSDSIGEIVVPEPNQIKISGDQRFLHWNQTIIPVYRLDQLLNYACPLPEIPTSQALVGVTSPEDWASPMLIMRGEQQVFALEIDNLGTEQELVIKPFGSAIAPPSYAYGCTILGDGTLIPVIDATVLLNLTLEQTTGATGVTTATHDTTALNQDSSFNQTSTTIRAAQAPTILVVDDAVTLRRTLALTLERVGFRVLEARDGREAIEQLQQSSSVNLVVCDIEMPNMNGFDFLSHRRQDSQLSKIPVVMLTSRSSEKHQWLAKHLGATAYFTKPFLEQELVAELKQILGIRY
ncbi:MAG: response regulator [Symploca sp. SIO2C1]|nr:response regulator [Symploca sp. SIO2C1]